jgi:hypothetical protein
MAWGRANWLTRRSPGSVKATTDGVVRAPSAFAITVGWPPSTAAITEFVVPGSMPTALAVVASSTGGHCRASAGRPSLRLNDDRLGAERASALLHRNSHSDGVSIGRFTN